MNTYSSANAPAMTSSDAAQPAARAGGARAPEQEQRHEAAGDDVAPPEELRVDAAVAQDEALERGLLREVAVGEVVDQHEEQHGDDEEARAGCCMRRRSVRGQRERRSTRRAPTGRRGTRRAPRRATSRGTAAIRSARAERLPRDEEREDRAGARGQDDPPRERRDARGARPVDPSRRSISVHRYTATIAAMPE